MPTVLAGLEPLAIAGLVLAFFTALTVLNVAVGFAAERLMPGRRIFAVKLAPGQYRFELLGNVIFLAVATSALTAVLLSGLVRLGEESLLRGTATFFAMLFGFQIFYWGLHRAMHTRALIRIHAWHHRSHVTTPLTGQSMSFGESCGWMLGYAGLPLIFSLLVPISFWGWMAYLAFNVAGNIVGHANVELASPRLVSRRTAALSNPFVYHALHHARWRGHYGFQAALMDRLFGTELPDWPVLFQRVSAGRPLASLKERGD